MSADKDKRALIGRLHRIYTERTGHALSLHMGRISAWWQWVNFRPDEPFNEADLELVIKALQWGIKDGKRNPGSLRFFNLIAMPDMFEEELALAASSKRAASKPRPPATVQHTANGTSRVVPNQNLGDTSRAAGEILPAERLREHIDAMRKAIQ